MKRMPGIVGLLVVALLSGCSALGAKANPTASAPAAQAPPVSSTAFDTYISKPGIPGDFITMDGTRNSTDTALGLRLMSERIPCMTDYAGKVALAVQAGYLHAADRMAYLMEFRFPSNEQAEAVQQVAPDLIQCVAKDGIGTTFSPLGSIKAGDKEYPVYTPMAGEVYRVVGPDPWSWTR